MKKKFICFAILILTAYILLYPADAVNASRNGLMLWYEKVLPTLLPFAIISNVLIHSGYMDALTKHLTKYFRFFMPVSGEGVFIYFVQRFFIRLSNGKQKLRRTFKGK